MVAAVGLGAVVCEACGSPARNDATGGSELGLLPTGGDDEEDGSVLAIRGLPASDEDRGSAGRSCR